MNKTRIIILLLGMGQVYCQLKQSFWEGPYFAPQLFGDTAAFVFTPPLGVKTNNAGVSGVLQLNTWNWSPDPDSAFIVRQKIQLDLAPSSSNQVSSYWSPHLFWEWGESGSNDQIRFYWEDSLGLRSLVAFDTLLGNGGTVVLEWHYQPKMGHYLKLLMDQQVIEVKQVDLPQHVVNLGLHFKVEHTATRGNDFYLNFFEAKYSNLIDTLGPYIKNYFWSSPQHLSLVFNEEVRVDNMSFNHIINDYILLNDTLSLVLEEAMKNGDTLISAPLGLSDRNGNRTDLFLSIPYLDTYYPVSPGDLQITAFKVDDPEVIILSNLSEHAIALEGWFWSDASSGPIAFPDTVLYAGQHFIWSKTPMNEPTIYHGGNFPTLNDGGETFYLFNPTDTLQYFEYGAGFEDQDQSLQVLKYHRTQCFSPPFWSPIGWDSISFPYQWQGKTAPLPKILQAQRKGQSSYFTLSWENEMQLLEPKEQTVIHPQHYIVWDSLQQSYYIDPHPTGPLLLSLPEVSLCNGNQLQLEQLLTWPTYSRLSPGHLMINEVMFDPETGAPEYIELEKKTVDSLWCDSLYFELTLENDTFFSAAYTGPITTLYPTFFKEGGALESHYAEVDTNALYPLPTWINLKSAPFQLRLINKAEQIGVVRLSPEDHAQFLSRSKGVSLERVYSQNGTSYFTSATANYGFATPTKQNSNQILAPFTGSFSLSQYIWDDSRQDVPLYLRWEQQEPQLLALDLYDLQGHWIERILPSTSVSAEGAIRIELYSKYNLPLPSGIYIILVDAYGLESGERLRKRIEIGVYRP